MSTVPTPDQLVDIEACRETARRYCRGLDRLDPDEMRSAYWPNAVDEHGAFNGNAWKFVDICMTGHDAYSSTMHTIFNHTVVLDDGEHARGELYNVTWLRRVDGDVLDVWFGRYLDRYERRGDEWRIVHRVCVHEHDMSVDASTPMPMPTGRFVQGSFDRGTPGRLVGPDQR